MILDQKTRFWPNFGPRNKHFSAPKQRVNNPVTMTTKQQYLGNYSCFFSIPIKYWQKNYAGWKLYHRRCENEQKKFSDNFSQNSHSFCIVPDINASPKDARGLLEREALERRKWSERKGVVRFRGNILWYQLSHLFTTTAPPTEQNVQNQRNFTCHYIFGVSWHYFGCLPTYGVLGLERHASVTWF